MSITRVATVEFFIVQLFFVQHRSVQLWLTKRKIRRSRSVEALSPSDLPLSPSPSFTSLLLFTERKRGCLCVGHNLSLSWLWAFISLYRPETG